jgi:hypothetical protein
MQLKKVCGPPCLVLSLCLLTDTFVLIKKESSRNVEFKRDRIFLKL